MIFFSLKEQIEAPIRKLESIFRKDGPSFSGGGEGSDSDFRWDGRRHDEEEEAYRRRSLLAAVKDIRTPSKRTIRR